MGFILDIFFNTTLTIFFIAIVGFIISRLLKRNDIVDSIWGIGFLIVTIVNIPSFTEMNFISKLVLALIAVWSIRLSTYLTFRNLRKEEDKRYVKMIKSWGGNATVQAFFKIFILQSVLIGIISIPMSLIMVVNPDYVSPWSFLGLTLFIIGFLFEVCADWELFNFKKTSTANDVLSSGVWGLSRHPNYLGEILMIWSFFFFALALPYGIYSIISPILLSFLIIKVSGVSMLEASMKDKGEKYKEYIQNVPVLFPISKHSALVFFKVLITTTLLDFFWLGFLFNEFYVTQTKNVARLTATGFDTLYWAAAFVYFFIPIGIVFFAIKGASSRVQAGFRGAIFGLVTYGIYDFTNLALIKNWPYEMSLIDLCWGPILCGVSGFIGYTNQDQKN